MDRPIDKPLDAGVPPSDFLRDLTGDTLGEHLEPGRRPEESRVDGVPVNAASGAGERPSGEASDEDGEPAVARPSSPKPSAGAIPDGSHPPEKTVAEAKVVTHQQHQASAPMRSIDAASSARGSVAGAASVTPVEHGRPSGGLATDSAQPHRGRSGEQGPDRLLEGLDIRPNMSDAERAELRRRLNPTKEDAGLALVGLWFELIDDLAKHGTPYKKVLLAMLAGRDRDRFEEEFGEDHKKLGRTYAKIRAARSKG